MHEDRCDCFITENTKEGKQKRQLVTRQGRGYYTIIKTTTRRSNYDIGVNDWDKDRIGANGV